MVDSNDRDNVKKLFIRPLITFGYYVLVFSGAIGIRYLASTPWGKTHTITIFGSIFLILGIIFGSAFISNKYSKKEDSPIEPVIIIKNTKTGFFDKERGLFDLVKYLLLFILVGPILIFLLLSFIYLLTYLF